MRMFNKLDWGRVSEADIEVILGALDRALLVESKLFIEIGCFSMRTSRKIYDYIAEHFNTFTLFSLEVRAGSLKRHWPTQFGDLINDGRSVFLLGRSADVAKIIHAKFAFVMIDACHCFDCVVNDIALWAPKVAMGGQLVMHDTSVRIQKDKREWRGPHAQTAVRMAIEESQEKLAGFELVAENPERPGVQAFERRR